MTRKEIVQQISKLLDDCETCPKQKKRSQIQHQKRCMGCDAYYEMQALGKKLLGGKPFSVYGKKVVDLDVV